MFTFGLLLQAPALENQAGNQESTSNIFHLISASDPIVQITLLILVVFSVISWATILFKFLQVKKARNSGRQFLKMYEQADSLDEVVAKATAREGNPFYEVFSEALSEIIRYRQLRSKDPASAGTLSLEKIHRIIQNTTNESLERLENMLPFLANTASSSPFVGLFGTVWGILQAFWNIGKTGNTSLATVGPAISEALVATAVGLAAAIPAVLGYNYFQTKVRRLSKDLYLFGEDLQLRIKKEFF
ncbi:MAG: MotA/TolQ/ExbB proton channel family protein [Deltaproteobacteria bacterium]|nr:MotA/TolQ/ExbB proton channel family protein [Deltaproteobacteria bacterium]